MAWPRALGAVSTAAADGPARPAASAESDCVSSELSFLSQGTGSLLREGDTLTMEHQIKRKHNWTL